MNFLTLVNGLRTFASRVDFIDIANGAFRIRLTGTATADRQVNLPNDSGIVLLDDRPVGSTGAGVSVRGYSPNVTVPASKILALSDANTSQICTAASTITVPANATVAFPIGTEILLLRNTSGTITLALTAGVTVTDRDGATNTLTDVRNFTLLKKTGNDAWIAVNPTPSNAFLPGNPTTTTQPVDTNNTTVSTTAFVQNAVATRLLSNRVALNPLNCDYPASSNVIIDTINATPCIAFISASGTSGIWRFPPLRDYVGQGVTITLECAMVSAVTGNVAITASIESHLPGTDTIASDSFATAISSGAVAVPATAGTYFNVSISLSDAQLDGLTNLRFWRLRLSRDTTIASNATGNLRLAFGEVRC